MIKINHFLSGQTFRLSKWVINDSAVGVISTGT
jgi:hypothetical protein